MFLKKTRLLGKFFTPPLARLWSAAGQAARRTAEPTDLGQGVGDK